MYLGDYHTHTTLSHGKGAIEDNVIAAIKLGLKEIAITDHGFGHGCYAVKRSDFDIARAEVIRLREKYPEINIMLGLECNMLTSSGKIDLNEGEADKLDIILCGFHKVVRTDLSSALGFCFPNVLGVGGRQALVKNTDAYIRLIEKNEIDILTHINCAIKADAIEVAKACKHYGTYLELNGKRINLTDGEIEKIVEMETPLIVGSDAHSPDRVGDFSVPQSVVDRLKIPNKLIANQGKIPSFRSRRQK